MVDEASEVSTLCSIDDGVVINTEHVAAADAFLLITLLPHVRDHLHTHTHTELIYTPLPMLHTNTLPLITIPEPKSIILNHILNLRPCTLAKNDSALHNYFTLSLNKRVSEFYVNSEPTRVSLHILWLLPV